METVTLTLPKIPPYELLVSMAMIMRHDFGLDKPIGNDIISRLSAGMLPGEREQLLIDMGCVYEEIIGQGFYQWNGDNSCYAPGGQFNPTPPKRDETTKLNDA